MLAEPKGAKKLTAEDRRGLTALSGPTSTRTAPSDASTRILPSPYHGPADRRTHTAGLACAWPDAVLRSAGSLRRQRGLLSDGPVELCQKYAVATCDRLPSHMSMVAGAGDDEQASPTLGGAQMVADR
ncbi:hypothetical protein ACIBCU_21340 [Streptomyces sp. NPDC051064]|uniref:hypothetical protein n=1 Tax=Streptomyces sp. NPDC051064 TaxID=3365641 RepID=UPI0037AB3436